jgi:acetoacetyl-CoA synthetase
VYLTDFLHNQISLGKVRRYMKKNKEFLWEPDQQAIKTAQMTQFRHFVNRSFELNLEDYFGLHAWSIAHPDLFWQAIWSFMAVIAASSPRQIMIPAAKMQETEWFPGARLNFAENLLKYRDDKTALIFRSESGATQLLSYQALYQQVSALAKWLRDHGVVAKDRVAGWLPNCPETVIAMLATTSLGAIWTACSPDFGVQGLLDRFSQIEPKILFAADKHVYGGKEFHHLKEIHVLQEKLSSLRHTVIVSANATSDLNSLLTPAHLWQDCLNTSPAPLNFAPLPFNHPVYILYSSGTTGKPKCMVHGAGGTLLQHQKELRLHTDLVREDIIFFYTTCAWMMWHWLISSLAVGATVVLYEGNPFYPKKTALFDLIDEFDVTVFGAGAKIIEAAQKFGLQPRQSHALKNLRTILTTGSPLLPKSFDYVYRDVKSSLCLSSISGGSDIISCFALGNPVLPVYRGELQCLGLGMDVRIFNEHGQEIKNVAGELVCGTPFPSMPVYFWNDAKGEKYQQAYFDRFPGVWSHGDYAQLTAHGGLIIYGRSDATLNPGGIRIGTAEIYQQTEKFSEIAECLAVGQSGADGERIILFVTLREDQHLTKELISSIKNTIRQHTSPHHVPAKIIQAPDLPRTQNGKLMEIAVKKIINHQPLTQTEALANPQSLEFFKTLEF